MTDNRRAEINEKQKVPDKVEVMKRVEYEKLSFKELVLRWLFEQPGIDFGFLKKNKLLQPMKNIVSSHKTILHHLAEL